jgi:hypothetical protein
VNDVATDVMQLYDQFLLYYQGTTQRFTSYSDSNQVFSCVRAITLERENKHGQNGQSQKADRVRIRTWQGGAESRQTDLVAKMGRRGLDDKTRKVTLWTQQNAGTGIKPGSSAVDTSTRRELRRTITS